jgi:hypothetical protein
MTVSFKPNMQKDEIWNEEIFRNKVDTLASTEFNGKKVWIKKHLTPKNSSGFESFIWKIAKYSHHLRKILIGTNVKRERSILIRMGQTIDADPNLQKDTKFRESYNKTIKNFNDYISKLTPKTSTHYRIDTLLRIKKKESKQEEKKFPFLNALGEQFLSEMRSTSQNHLSAADWCIQHDVNIDNEQKKLGHPLLHLLVHSNNLEGIKWLMTQPNFDPNVNNFPEMFSDSRNIIQKQLYGFLYGNPKSELNKEACELVIRHPQFDPNITIKIPRRKVSVGCEPLPDRFPLLHVLYELPDPHLLYCLLDKDSLNLNVTRFSNERPTVLERAISDQNKEVTSKILSKVDLATFSPLLLKDLAFASVNGGNVDLLSDLLQRFPTAVNLQMKDYYRTFLQCAIRTKNMDMIKFLLQHPQIDPNENDGTPLALGIKSNDIEIVKLIMSHPKFDKNKQNSHWRAPPLFLALERNSKEMIKLFLNDPNVETKFMRNSLLHYIHEETPLEVIELLLTDHRLKLDINAKSFDGKTPIFLLLLQLRILLFEKKPQDRQDKVLAIINRLKEVPGIDMDIECSIGALGNISSAKLLHNLLHGDLMMSKLSFNATRP